jgi:capsular polysaccharide transport system permease protein
MTTRTPALHDSPGKAALVARENGNGEDIMDVRNPTMKLELAPRRAASLGSDLRRYFGVILALLRYEEELRRADPMEAVMEMIEPVLLITVMATAMWFIGRRAASPLGGNTILFYATGFFALYFFIYLSNRMKRSVDAPSQRFPIERRLDHIIVHLILKVVHYLTMGTLLFGVIYVFFTPRALPYDFTPILEAAIAMIMIGFGWGILNMIVSRHWRLWNYIYPSVNRCLVLFTGVMFLIDFLPPGARYVLSFIPIAHAVALFRTGFYPNYPKMMLDPEYLAYCSVFAVVFGLVLERVTRRYEGR